MPNLIKLNPNGTQQVYAGRSTSTGAGSAGDFPILDSSGRLDTSLMPVGIGEDTVIAEAGEALSAGDMVYFTSTGTVMKADATVIAKMAHGYILVSTAVGVDVKVYFDDSNTSLIGLTPGATYYLDLTAGKVVTTPPVATGTIVQEIGFATSPTNLRVNIQEPIIN